MILIAGPSANGISERLAELSGEKAYSAVHKVFPDGESYIKIPTEIAGEDVAVIQSTNTPQDKSLMELFFMIDKVRAAGAKSVTAIVPYMGYMRQNKEFNEGEAVSISTIISILNSLRLDNLITIQPHKSGPLRAFKGKTVIVDVIRKMARYAGEGMHNPLVLAPDKGALEIARKAAASIGCAYTYIDKERLNDTKVGIKHSPSESMTGKDVMIIDDMISTGGTIVQAAEFARSRGAENVRVAAVHLIMAGNAEEKLRNAGISEICGTNTLPFKGTKTFDISEEIAKSLGDIKSE